MTFIYLVRHGETLWNVEGRIQGHGDSPLTDAGRAQAQQVAHALARMPLQAIYTSDLTRAAETGDAIAAPHALTPRRDPRLREVFFGVWEGLLLEQITEGWPREAAAWRTDSLHHRPPGGETLEAVQARIAASLTEIVVAFPEGAVAVVGHGGSLRAAVAAALDTTPAVSRHLQFDNGSLTTLEYSRDRFMLRCLNDTCHLRELPHSTGAG